jgi:hypothetical protein
MLFMRFVCLRFKAAVFSVFKADATREDAALCRIIHDFT